MITVEEIKKLAALARMELSSEEAEKMTKEIDSILDYVGQVQNVGKGVESDISDLRNVMRDDVVTHAPGEYSEKLLSNAPFRKGKLLKVKKIL